MLNAGSSIGSSHQNSHIKRRYLSSCSRLTPTHLAHLIAAQHCDVASAHQRTDPDLHLHQSELYPTTIMGIFGLFSSQEDKRKEEVRTGARAPDRSERRQCWDARDSFYQCLDKHDVIDSLTGDGKKTADKHCAQEDVAFHDNCANAWVSSLSPLPPSVYGRTNHLLTNRVRSHTLRNTASPSTKRRRPSSACRRRARTK